LAPHLPRKVEPEAEDSRRELPPALRRGAARHPPAREGQRVRVAEELVEGQGAQRPGEGREVVEGDLVAWIQQLLARQEEACGGDGGADDARTGMKERSQWLM